MSYFVNGHLFTEVLPLCGCWTFLKANKSPGWTTCFSSLWTCAQCAGGPLHEVFCIPHVLTCTGFACCTVAVITAGAEDVVVLKGVSISGVVGPVLELYWHCMALHLFCMSCRIWNTFNIPSGVLLPVLFPGLT